ncbi:MAG: serine/threonine-protein kinase [Gemmatimonadales bacterium]
MFCSRCGTEVEKGIGFCPTCGLDLRAATPAQGAPGVDANEHDIVRDALSDEYELLDELGRGGMAIVYHARDKHLERAVAIKVLPFSLAFDAEFVERFTREARTSAQLEHPNIISIYRVGKNGRVIYFVMKMLRGGSLARIMAERKTLAPAEVKKLLAEVGSALGYAHKRGIVHRDIKPDNIMFDEFGQCVVTDFGIAKAGSGSKLTGTGMSIGTPHYMSPEQARAQSIDGRSDLYSLGIVAYQAMVGEVPYDGEDSFAIGYKHIMEPIPVPLFDTSEERRLFEIVKRLIMKDPFDRFQSAEDLLKALEGQPGTLAPPGRRPSAVQAALVEPSMSPVPATVAPPFGKANASPPPAPRPSVVSTSGPVPGMDTPRRPAIRRSTVTQPAPVRTGSVHWAVAGLVILGLILGATALYKKGLLGGAVDSTRPPIDSAAAAGVDSQVVYDSTALSPSLGGYDSLPIDVGSPHRPAATPITPLPIVETVSGDSGFLRLMNLPRGSQVLIDSRQATQSGVVIRLRAGWHELAVTASGFEFFTDSVKIEPGGTLVYTPSLVATGAPAPAPGSQAELNRRILARLDCEVPAAANKFGRACYDTPPRPVGSTRVPVPAGADASPSSVVLVVRVSRQGRTTAVRTLTRSSDEAFTRAVETYAQTLQWTPALREGRPVDGWTQASFVPDIP